MKPASSKIWEEYRKIAKEKNLLPEKKETKTDVSKFDPSDLEMLYGFKLDPEILERAHPETAILFPAHDKFNGVVENLSERQDRMLEIVNRTPRPTLTQHIYVSATEDLKNELLKVAWKLDQEDQFDLMSTADSCLDQMTKQALAPLAIVGIGAAITALYAGLSQKFQFSQGVKNDCESFLEEAQEAMEKIPGLKNDLSVLIEQVKMLKSAAEEVAKMAFIFQPSPDQEKLTEQALKTIKEKQDLQAIQKLEGFKNGCAELKEILPDYISILQMKQEQYQEGYSSFMAPLVQIWRTVVPSDFEDVIIELNKLFASVSAAPQKITAQINLFKKMRAKINSVQKFQQTLNQENTEKNPEVKTNSTPEKPTQETSEAPAIEVKPTVRPTTLDLS